MTSRTHDAFAFATLVTVAALFPPHGISLQTMIAAILAADMGGLIPDMDTAGNRLWELLPQGTKLAKVLRKIFYKHRTLTHSLIGVYGLYRFFDWVLPKILNTTFFDVDIILWSLMIGIGSHILSDSFTEEGVPLLFPFRIAFGIPPIRSWRIKTGQWFETFVVFPAIGVYVIWLVYKNEATFLSLLRSLR